MNKCIYILIVVVLYLMISCGFDKSVSFENDMDLQYNWSDCRPQNLIFDKFAKSGHIVCCLDPKNPYSPSINKRKDEIKLNPINKIIISGFFLVKNKSTKPTFVVDFRDSLNQCFELVGQSFEDFGRVNEWVYCEFEVSTKEKDSLNRALFYRVYANNPSLDTVLLDDFCVEFK